MPKRMNRGTEKRNQLLKFCLDHDIPYSKISEMVEPMRDKTDEEKEQIAEELLKELMKTTLTQTEQLLAYGLNQFPINEDDKLTILGFLREEEDQLLMIHYLKAHPAAQEKDIMNEYGEILTRRKRLTE